MEKCSQFQGNTNEKRLPFKQSAHGDNLHKTWEKYVENMSMDEKSKKTIC